MAAKKLFAQRSFLDGKQRKILLGDVVDPEDYAENVIKSYKDRGLVGDKKPAMPSSRKPAEPAEKK